MAQAIEGGLVRRARSEPTSWTWQDRAACRSQPAPFFGSGDLEVAEARAICGRCPVRLSCLWFALEHGERFGIWGGRTEGERNAMSEHERRAAERGAEREAAGDLTRVVRGL